MCWLVFSVTRRRSSTRRPHLRPRRQGAFSTLLGRRTTTRRRSATRRTTLTRTGGTRVRLPRYTTCTRDLGPEAVRRGARRRRRRPPSCSRPARWRHRRWSWRPPPARRHPLRPWIIHTQDLLDSSIRVIPRRILIIVSFNLKHLDHLIMDDYSPFFGCTY